MTAENGHGVASWATLRKAGFTRTDLRHALADGGLTRVRRGWYATADADATVLAAVKAGGVCSCLSALKLHGVWVPEFQKLHYRARPSAHNKRGADFCCRRYGRPLPEGCAVDDVATALQHAVRCLDLEGTVVVLDSLQNLGLLDEPQIRAALRECPDGIRAAVDRCSESGAGTETMVRLRLESRNIKVKTQVDIPGVGIVDLVVGNRLIIEVDGQEYHHSPEQFQKDRARDRKAVELGYLVIRLTYRDVVHDWKTVEPDILGVIRRGDHLRNLPTVPTVTSRRRRRRIRRAAATTSP